MKPEIGNLCNSHCDLKVVKERGRSQNLSCFSNERLSKLTII